MKPHEEEWVFDGQGGIWVNGRPVLTHHDRCILAAAAPDMARALMGPSGKGHHAYNPQHDEYACHRCAHFAPSHANGCDFGDALRKAGVIL